MATPSSIVAWKIPGTEEPGGLQSMGSQSQTRLSDSHHHCYFSESNSGSSFLAAFFFPVSNLKSAKISREH